MTTYLSHTDMLDLHGYVIERYGGRLGITSTDRLHSLIEAPSQMMFGQELYSDLPAKAAALAFYLIKNRPFRSGNAATAWLAVQRFAHINRSIIDDPVALARELAALARSERTHDDLAAWFSDHIQSSRKPVFNLRSRHG